MPAVRRPLNRRRCSRPRAMIGLVLAGRVRGRAPAADGRRQEMLSRFVSRSFALACSLSLAVAQTGWSVVAPLSVPPPRASTHLAYDFNRGVTVMFGGWPAIGFPPTNDTWEWNGANWTARQLALTPPARKDGAFGYDLLRARIVLFGGTD